MFQHFTRTPLAAAGLTIVVACHGDAVVRTAAHETTTGDPGTGACAVVDLVID